MPSSPPRPGATTASTDSESTRRSGVTTSSWSVAISKPGEEGKRGRGKGEANQSLLPLPFSPFTLFPLFIILLLLRDRRSFLHGFFDRTYHVEGLLRQIVVLAVNDFAEAFDRIFQLYVFPFQTGELSGHEERLRE